MRRPFLFLTLLIALSTCAAVLPARAQVVGGRVLDEGTEAPIAGATITIREVGGRLYRRTDSDTLGLFLMVARPGRYMIEATRLGYLQAAGGPLPLGKGDTLIVDLFMTADPVLLDEVNVSGERILPHLDRVGFYQRQKAGFGTFITRDEIRKRNPMYPHEILYGIRGVKIVRRPDGVRIRSNRSDCEGRVFVDGTMVAGPGIDFSMDAAVTVDAIEAVEVYAGTGGVPVRYLNDCMTVLIWTRL